MYAFANTRHSRPALVALSLIASACLAPVPPTEATTASVGIPYQLGSGERLNPGESRATIDGRYRLTYQTDGNLVLYDGVEALWHTNTWGTSPGYAAMQDDGNLVVYDSAGAPRWWSNTFWQGTTANVFLEVDGDGRPTGRGNLTLCDASGNGFVWSSTGNQNGCRFYGGGSGGGGGGGNPLRSCSGQCSGCMPLGQCLNQMDQSWESCEDTGYSGSDGACYRLRSVPASCSQYSSMESSCQDCWGSCSGRCPSSLPPLCWCEYTGHVDRNGNQCCVQETMDPYCYW